MNTSAAVEVADDWQITILAERDDGASLVEAAIPVEIMMPDATSVHADLIDSVPVEVAHDLQIAVAAQLE